MAAVAPLTDLIRRAQFGEAGALHGVFDAAYDDLRSLARARLRKGGRNTLLDTTSLVHESFLRVIGTLGVRIGDRQHFMCYASHVMRSIIVDELRSRLALRRGGGAPRVTLDSRIDDGLEVAGDEILRIHDALDDLGRYDPRMVEVVEMRYFAGMTECEIADVLGVTERTVRRDWEKARLLLAEALA
jgi:RNA polymerase sigma factor (TIGR02999 family)